MDSRVNCRGMCFSLVLVTLACIGSTESLKCYTCSNVSHISNCLTVMICSADEECYTEAYGTGNNTAYKLGCRTFSQCHGSSTTNLPISIVGRDVASSGPPITCSGCCAVDSCNDKLCTRASEVFVPTNGQCHDDPDYNCELVSGLFDVCKDIQHAKIACRKWCGLCQLVDGSWSSWLGWSACDVTCGNGHNSRSRSCTEPKPSHGGLDCVGQTVDTSNCTAITCPVHGGWSTWSHWGECSVTCGTGLQRRDRSCSNPFPGPSGNHCFGDSRDDRVCFLKSCIDGQWSNWASWGSCSATCDGGLKSRYRQCDNPKPSQFGKQCDGNNEDYSACNIHGCPAPVVIFSVNTPSSTTAEGSTTGGVPIFTKVLSNIGNSYNTTSGEFKCTIRGTYLFSLSFLTLSASYCNIRHNGLITVQAYTSGSSDYQSATASTYISLTIGDIVELYCSGYQHITKNYNTMFSGALIASV